MAAVRIGSCPEYLNIARQTCGTLMRYLRRMIDDKNQASAASTIERCDEGLRAFGLRPIREDEGGFRLLKFRYEFERFSMWVHDEDPGYLHVRLGYSASEEVRSQRERARETVNALNYQLKSVKVVVDEDGDLCVSYESFIGPNFDIEPVLERLLDAMRGAAREFFKVMQEAA